MNFCTQFLGLFKYKFYRSLCTNPPKNPTTTRVSHKTAINKFFIENELTSIKEHIPPQYLTLRRTSSVTNLRLICPNTAKIIAPYVKAAYEANPDQIIAETNAGLGLIAAELLDSGVKPNFGTVYPGQVELFTKDIFHLNRYSYMDQQDGSQRVDVLLRNVPKKSWIDEPSMTIVGAMTSLNFLIYLVKCLCLQKDIVRYGRFQIFAIMKPKHYAVLKATPEDLLTAYKHWTILFNLLFDYELLEKFPRKMFIPWESPLRKTQINRYPTNLEPDKLYFVKINLKKQLPVSAEHLLPLFYFVRHLFGTGSKPVIPTIEKWIPGCGLNMLLPKLKHPDYFEDLGIFTQFRELTPTQILAVFKEMVNYPSYAGSPLIAMMEADLVKYETTETSLNEATSLEKTIVDDIEQKLDLK